MLSGFWEEEAEEPIARTEMELLLYSLKQLESKAKGLNFGEITNWDFEEMDVNVVVKLILQWLNAIAEADLE